MALAGNKDFSEEGVKGYQVPLWKNNREPIPALPKGTNMTFIDEIMKKHKKMPGPAQYKHESKIFDGIKDNYIISKSPRNTEIDQIISKASKFKNPGVGQYEIAKKIKIYGGTIDKEDKITYVDSIMFESKQKPGIYSKSYKLVEKKSIEPIMG